MLQRAAQTRAGNLSGGEQQASAIGRALMTNPRLCCSTKFRSGWRRWPSRPCTARMGSLIQSGATIVLVEQDIGRALGVATRIICMLEGRIVLQGSANDMTREQVTRALFRPAPRRSRGRA